jgi:hypothetical protein
MKDFRQPTGQHAEEMGDLHIREITEPAPGDM